MKVEQRPALIEHLEKIHDPRRERTKRHKLIDVLVIAVCATICGAEAWTEMEEFGEAKEGWFRTFLELPHGIPSHDTFRRVFMLLKPAEFQRSFLSWVEELASLVKAELVSIDGKHVRGTRSAQDKRAGREGLRMVSAWASEQRLVLGQVKTEEKSNEITAIPELLRMLEIAGCIVTIDAMGCQKEIAAQIVEQEADYVLSLKGNQGTLHKDVADYFEWAEKIKFKGIDHSLTETIEKDHGSFREDACRIREKNAAEKSNEDAFALELVANLPSCHQLKYRTCYSYIIYIIGRIVSDRNRSVGKCPCFPGVFTWISHRSVEFSPFLRLYTH